jgi:outer membrane lipoprotein SlyB
MFNIKTYKNIDEIIYEDTITRSNKIEQILKDCKDLNDMSNEIALLTQSQQYNIDNIETLVECSSLNIKESSNNIKTAAKIKNKMNVFYGVGICSTIGVGIGSLLGPLGMIGGASIGAIIGGTVSNSISKKQITILDKEYNSIH